VIAGGGGLKRPKPELGCSAIEEKEEEKRRLRFVTPEGCVQLHVSKDKPEFMCNWLLLLIFTSNGVQRDIY
jgi:hypothetical protein